MHEVDLVPGAYRRWLWLRRQAWLYGGTLLAVIVCLGAARTFLVQGVARTADELRALQAEEQAMVGERARLDALRAREAELEARAGTLRRLAGGPPVAGLFAAVDASLDGRVTFREWVYETELDSGQATEAPVARHRMRIVGQASDHAALADFLRRLQVQALVAEVRLLDTQVRRYTESSRVEFSVAADLVAEPRS